MFRPKKEEMKGGGITRKEKTFLIVLKLLLCKKAFVMKSGFGTWSNLVFSCGHKALVISSVCPSKVCDEQASVGKDSNVGRFVVKGGNLKDKFQHIQTREHS